MKPVKASSQMASVFAERSINAALLAYPEIHEDGIDIGAEDFADEAQRVIFDTLAHMFADRSRLVSPLALCDELNRIGMLEAVGGQDAIRSMPSMVGSQSGTAAECKRSAEIVRHFAIRRKMIALAEDMKADAANSALDLDETIGQFQTAAANILSRASDRHETRSTYAEILARVEHDAVHPPEPGSGGLSTGIMQIDHMVKIERKLLTVIGGRPSSGKSALAQQILEHVASQGYGVLFASLEMHRAQVGMRAIAAESGIPVSVQKAGDVRAVRQLRDAVVKLSKYDIEVDERPAQSLAYIRKWVIRRKREGELGRRPPLYLLTVDYCQLMAPTDAKAPRHEQIQETTRALKVLAKEQNIAVLCLAQLNRGAEFRTDKTPEVGDLAGSDGITQDADIIMLTHRVPGDPKWEGRAQLVLGKVRDGAAGTVEVPFDGVHYRFGGWRKEDAR